MVSDTTLDTHVSFAGIEYTIRQLRSGDTGVSIWRSAYGLLEVLATLRTNWQGVKVVELGAGAGAVSIGLAKLGAIVYATDYDARTLKNLRFNIHTNKVAGRVQVFRWDWQEKPPKEIPFESIQYCVGSDVAFGCANPMPALTVIKDAAPEVEIILVLEERAGGAMQGRLDNCAKAGFAPEEAALSPKSGSGWLSIVRICDSNRSPDLDTSQHALQEMTTQSFGTLSSSAKQCP